MTDLHLAEALLPEGWARDVRLTVTDGVIAALSAGVAPRAGDRRLGGIAIPGVANLHSHTFQRGFAGLAERRGAGDDHFWTWREAMYRFANRLDPDEAEAIAALAFVEMLESGFTACAEFHYVHHRPDGRPYAEPAEIAVRIAAAAAATGIGLTLLPVFYAHSDFGGRAPLPEQARFVSDLDLYARLVEGCERVLPGRVGVAPHSLRAVSEGELTALVALHPGAPLHIHVAEQVREVEACLALTGARPVAWLLDHADIDARWCLVHATHMDLPETERLARSGATAGLCPITEANLGDGLFPAVAYRAAGGRFGVGSDSNVEVSLPGELRLLEYGQRLRERARNRLGTTDRSTGRALLEAAASGGAAALGRAMGAIAPGQAADLVLLDPEDPGLVGRTGDARLDAWVFGAAPRALREVIVAGRTVVTDGVHRDRPRVEAAWRSAMIRLADG